MTVIVKKENKEKMLAIFKEKFKEFPIQIDELPNGEYAINAEIRQLIPGRSFERIINSPTLSTEEIIRFFRKIAEIAEFARYGHVYHREGYSYGDSVFLLNPENFLDYLNEGADVKESFIVFDALNPDYKEKVGNKYIMVFKRKEKDKPMHDEKLHPLSYESYVGAITLRDIGTNKQDQKGIVVHSYNEDKHNIDRIIIGKMYWGFASGEFVNYEPNLRKALKELNRLFKQKGKEIVDFEETYKRILEGLEDNAYGKYLSSYVSYLDKITLRNINTNKKMYRLIIVHSCKKDKNKIKETTISQKCIPLKVELVSYKPNLRKALEELNQLFKQKGKEIVDFEETYKRILEGLKDYNQET